MRKGKIMFLPYHLTSFLDPNTLQLIAAFAVERELQDWRQREELEKSENENKCTSKPRP
jgi:hypothetical protein